MNKKTFKQWFALMVLLLMGTTASQAQSLTIDDFQIKPGESKAVTMKLDKGSLEAVYSVQVDIALSEGLSLEGEPELISGVLAGGSIASNTFSSGVTRISALSMSGKTFTADEIITLTVKAADTFESGTITLKNIEFAITAQGATFHPATATTNVTKEEEEQPGGETAWVKTSPANLATGDIVVIVDQTSSTAMANDKGTSLAPTATAVTLSTDKSTISSEVAETLQWVVTVDNGSYQFNVADTENYLYCTNSNNGVRVGTNSNNAFTIHDNNGVDFLLNTETGRYIGVYNNQDWRCYTSINANIRDCVTAFYKKTGGGDTPTPVETITNPLASLANGTYEGPQTVELTCETEGAAIYYTLDGTDPTAESTLYTESLTISETTTLKAIAIKGELRSAIVEYTYTIVPVAERATFDFNAYEGSTSSNTSTEGDITENLVIVEGNVTMTITPSDGDGNNPNRYWGTANGPQMRMYGGKMTLEAAEGKAIVKVEYDNGKWNNGNTFNGVAAATGTWEGNSTNVVLKVAANTQMNKVVVTLAEANEGTTTYDDPDAEDPEVTAAREALTNEIATATGMLDNETATAEQKEALQQAIAAAQAVADKADATKEELEAALGALQTAVETYLTPTGISTIEANGTDAPVYNLQGQRVQQVRTGLYIVNGKKMMK